MSLLREIQADATGTDVSIEVVLRKCLVLATRLGHAPLKEWVRHELDGYPDDADLPPFRDGYPVQLKGNFINAAWEARGQSVPIGALPDEFREDVPRTWAFRASITTIADMASKTTGDVITLSAPPVWRLRVRLYEMMQCSALWLEVSSHALGNIVDQVRNRVLSFVLEIEDQYPGAGEDTDSARPVPNDRIQAIYNTTIFGGINAIAAGGGSVNQRLTVDVRAGDLDGLLETMQTLGINAEDIAALKQAIEDDENSQPDEATGFGTRVREWLGRMTGKIATGTLKLARDVGAEVLAVAVAKYYGLI